MPLLKAEHFSLRATIESGQIFRYRKVADSYFVVAGGTMLWLGQRGNKIEYSSSEVDFDVPRFLGLGQAYSEILRSISHDERISAAVRKNYGLRIMQQEPWECIASFICSSFSNIPRIKLCIDRLAAAFGEKIDFNGVEAFSFPHPHQITSLAVLKKCGLGYRAEYLFETARIFSASEFSRRHLRNLGYPAAKEKLMELPGVGEKVANCILLFSYGFFEAFPVDVWIRRRMIEFYGSSLKSSFPGRKISEKIIARFARDYFGNYAGYAQQFLYYDARTSK